jgi:hypothetical protein
MTNYGNNNDDDDDDDNTDDDNDENFCQYVYLQWNNSQNFFPPNF